MRVSVVLSTYNQPRWLEKTLWGYGAQRHRDFELVIADDGSGEETAELLDRVRVSSGMDIVHVWHDDRGFRKCEILNRAVLASSCDYLVFSDGDCVPRNDFVATHVRLAEPGCFLSGGYLKLPLELSERIRQEDISSGRAFRPGWLRANGWRPGRRRLRLLSPAAGAILDRITPTGASWNGHNASVARQELLRVNGFDMDMGYGGEDRALGERMQNLGLRGRQIRFRAPCLHLYHERPYVDPRVLRENRRMREAIREQRIVRSPNGIAELTQDPV